MTETIYEKVPIVKHKYYPLNHNLDILNKKRPATKGSTRHSSVRRSVGVSKSASKKGLHRHNPASLNITRDKNTLPTPTSNRTPRPNNTKVWSRLYELSPGGSANHSAMIKSQSSDNVQSQFLTRKLEEVSRGANDKHTMSKWSWADPIEESGPGSYNIPRSFDLRNNSLLQKMPVYSIGKGQRTNKIILSKEIVKTQVGQDSPGSARYAPTFPQTGDQKGPRIVKPLKYSGRDQFIKKISDK